jgi:predicted deacylase
MSVQRFAIQLPTMTPGTSRSIQCLRFGRKGARPKLYIQAAIHANEMPGTMALHHLMPQLIEADEKGLIQGEIIVVPTVNPIGQAQLVGNQHLGRYNLLSYENYNRNWIDLAPAVAERIAKKLGQDAEENIALIRKTALAVLKELEPVNELRTLRVEIQKLSVDADFVLDLHCDIHAALHLFMAARDWPQGTATKSGPAYELAADLGSEATMYNEPYPSALTFSGVNGALWARLAERFPEASIPQACMSCTVEMRSQFDVSHAQGEQDAARLLRWIVRQGIIKGDPGRLPRLKVPATPMQGMDVGYCPKDGFLAYHLDPGAKVKKGQAVCDVIDPASPHGPKARTTVYAQTDGVLFAKRLNGSLAWPGLVLYRIAGEQRLAHRAGMSGLDD